ncbi:MAG TPA: O-antigen ligase family protein [Solirubrobacterales bacterium]
METGSMRGRDGLGDGDRRPDWAAVGAWLLCFGLVVFLGLEGGGYDPLVHDQVGIAAWWVVLVTVGLGVLPRRRLGTTALVSLGLLAALALWILLSLSWTESVERTFVDAARGLTYVGVFALVLLTRDSRETQRLIGAVAAGIAFVVGIALLSRLHPAWFDSAQQTGRILESEDRLSYPLNYWNALAALTAIGVPLLLQLATGARSVLARAASAAALPALMLTLYFTLSRGGIAAAAIATAIFLAFAADRLPKLLSFGVAACGGAILVVLAHGREELREGLTNSVAHDQGTELLLLGILVCLVVGAVQAAIALLGDRAERPTWTRPSRGFSAGACAAVAIALLLVAGLADAPGRASDGWSEFKEGGGPGEGTERLSSVAGENRYQFWSSAVDENATAPLNGTGSGTFQFWWAREGKGAETVHDAHSLYLQTLGELGIVGLGLLLAFLGFVLFCGVRNALLSDAAERSRLAAMLAGFSVFVMTAGVDWMWQVPAVPVAALMLAAGLTLGAAAKGEKPRLALGWRLGAVAAGLAAIVAIAIPLASLSLVRQSEAEARAGDLPAALEDARSAQNVEPAAASPRLQQALVLELLGDFTGAEAAAREATDRESTNWRNWLVLSRIAAEAGHAKASVAAYEEARALNPHASVFQR